MGLEGQQEHVHTAPLHVEQVAGLLGEVVGPYSGSYMSMTTMVSCMPHATGA